MKPKFFKSNIIYYYLFLFFVSLFFLFWRLNEIPGCVEFDGQRLLATALAMKLNCFNVLSSMWGGTYYKIFPLQTIYSTLWFSILSETRYAVCFGSAVLGLFTIFSLFYVVKKLFQDSEIAFLSSFLLAITTLNVILFRYVWISYTFILLLIIWFTFSTRLKKPILSGILLTLLIFNGHALGILLVGTIFLGYLIVDFKFYRRGLWKDLFKLFSSCLISLLLVLFLYHLWHQEGIFQPLKVAYVHWFVERYSSGKPFLSDIMGHFANFKKSFFIMFTGRPPDEYKWIGDLFKITTLPKPMVNISVCSLSLMGMLLFLIKRHSIHKLILLWFFIPYILTTFFLFGFTARYLFLYSPPMYISAAYALVFLRKKSLILVNKKIRLGVFQPKICINGVVVLFLIFLLFNSYHRYFNLYPQEYAKDFKSLKGYEKSFRWLYKNAENNSLLIIDHFYLDPYAYFETKFRYNYGKKNIYHYPADKIKKHGKNIYCVIQAYYPAFHDFLRYFEYEKYKPVKILKVGADITHFIYRLSADTYLGEKSSYLKEIDLSTPLNNKSFCLVSKNFIYSRAIVDKDSQIEYGFQIEKDGYYKVVLELQYMDTDEPVYSPGTLSYQIDDGKISRGFMPVKDSNYFPELTNNYKKTLTWRLPKVLQPRMYLKRGNHRIKLFNSEPFFGHGHQGIYGLYIKDANDKETY